MEIGGWGLSQELSRLLLQSEPPGGDRSDHEPKGLLPWPEEKQTRAPPFPPPSPATIFI